MLKESRDSLVFFALLIPTWDTFPFNSEIIYPRELSRLCYLFCETVSNGNKVTCKINFRNEDKIHSNFSGF